MYLGTIFDVWYLDTHINSQTITGKGLYTGLACRWSSDQFLDNMMSNLAFCLKGVSSLWIYIDEYVKH